MYLYLRKIEDISEVGTSTVCQGPWWPSGYVGSQLTAGNNLSCSLCQLVGPSCGKHLGMCMPSEGVAVQT